MPLLKAVGDRTFDPETLQLMVTAFELARDQLGLVGKKTDPMSIELASKVIELVEHGERDPRLLCALVVEQLHGK